MKTYLSVFSALILLLGSAVGAFAIHAEIPSDTQAVVAKGTTQLTLGGELRFRGEFREVDFDSDTSGDADYDLRVRLSLGAQVTPNTTGYVMLETGGSAGDTYKWANAGTGAKGGYQEGNAKPGGLTINQAWILHKGSGLLGIPAGLKVGHMPLALGNKLFFDHTKFGDDAIVFFVDPTKELHIGLLTTKFREGTTNDADDADAYVALFTYKGQGFNTSGDVTYVDDKKPASGIDDINMWNIGLRGDFALDTIKLKADLELQTGSAHNGDVDFAGYAFLVGADVKLDPITLTAELAYGSGDDDPNDDKIEDFITSLGADLHYTYVYEYRTVNACNYQYGGICNTMYIKLGASAKPTPNMTASLNLFWLRANEVPAGQDEDIGIEIDPKITYKIDKNLTYFVEGGYLMAGDFWGTDPDDAYAIRNGILLSF